MLETWFTVFHYQPDPSRVHVPIVVSSEERDVPFRNHPEMLRTCHGNSSACRHSDNRGLYYCVLLMGLSSVLGDYLLVTEINRVAASIITSG